MGFFRRKKRSPADGPTATGPTVDAVPNESPVDAFESLIDREWDRLGSTGTWWTSGERISIAADARRAAAGEELSGDLPAPVEEATRRLSVEPATIRGTDVARWEMEGLDSFAYIELVGIVSRLMALDTASFGLDLKPRHLPEPRDGEPTRVRAEGAAITTGWTPTVGPAGAPSSLSAVPAEAEAMFDAHGVLYLSTDDMFEMQITREGLTRPQMELAAARTSVLNDCFYLLLAHASMLRASINT